MMPLKVKVKDMVGIKKQGRVLLSDGDFLNVSDWLTTAPPVRRYIIEDFLPEDITAVMNSPGGLGKSNLLLLLCVCVATGINIAPFNVKKPRKVIMINVEDSEDDIKRRIHALGQVYPEIVEAKDLIEKNLKCYAGRGKLSTLMSIKNGVPVKTQDGEWLLQSFIQLQPELVILDTKSRLYGLEENSNDHAARWWFLFEDLITKLDNGCTVLVASHSNKAGSNTATQYSNRGASAFIDNARFNIVLSEITDKESKLLGIDQLDHFAMLNPKANYTKRQPKMYFHKTDKEGVPKYCTAVADRFNAATEYLAELVSEEDGGRIGNRELSQRPDGRDIREAIKKEFGFEKCDMDKLIAGAVQDGKLLLVGVGKKKVLEATIRGD